VQHFTTNGVWSSTIVHFHVLHCHAI
jgi:hypothetical protein